MIVKGAGMFRQYIDVLSYIFRDIAEVLDELSYFAKYFNNAVAYLYSLMGDTIKAYSLYLFVFYAKRFEFYIFWMFIVLAYC